MQLMTVPALTLAKIKWTHSLSLPEATIPRSSAKQTSAMTSGQRYAVRYTFYIGEEDMQQKEHRIDHTRRRTYQRLCSGTLKPLAEFFGERKRERERKAHTGSPYPRALKLTSPVCPQVCAPIPGEAAQFHEESCRRKNGTRLCVAESALCCRESQIHCARD